MIVIGEADVFKANIMPVRAEQLRTLCNRRILDLIQTVRRDLGDKHLRNQCERLVEWRVNACDDHQKHEKQHEVDFSGEDQRRAGEDRRCHAQPHDDGSTVDEKPDYKLTGFHCLFKTVDFFIESEQILFFTVGRADLADVFKGFLNIVRYRQRVSLERFRGVLVDLSAAEQQEECHGNTP